MTLDLKFLRDLCLCPAPSGFEAGLQRLLRQRLECVSGKPEAHADPLGNLWSSVGPEDGPSVVAIAHADQIGLIITHVEEAGYLRFGAIGLVDPALLPGHTVVVQSSLGPVRGVVGRPPTHVIPEAERGKAAPFEEQFIDIGARNRSDALERVGIGDAVTFDAGFHELSPGRFASIAMDDRAGVYSVFRALELYGSETGSARLTAVASSHEETTLMGARALAQRLKPDCVVVVDGDFASDYPGVDAAKLFGASALGEGPIVGRGTTTNSLLTSLALEVAADNGIAVQIKAYPGCMLTDADEMAAAGTAASLALSIPMRYVHSPAEVLSGDDVEAAAMLIAALARRIGQVFRPSLFVDSE
jgi:putative aminopeptidase FrvX